MGLDRSNTPRTRSPNPPTLTMPLTYHIRGGSDHQDLGVRQSNGAESGAVWHAGVCQTSPCRCRIVLSSWLELLALA